MPILSTPSLGLDVPNLQGLDEEILPSSSSLGFDGVELHSETNPWLLLTFGSVLTITQVSDFVLELDFSTPIDATGGSLAAALDPASYSVDLVGTGFDLVTVASAAVVSPTRIRVTLGTLSTDGEVYRLTISGAILLATGKSLAGTAVDYLAAVTRPAVADVVPASASTLSVTFTREMRKNAALTDASKYLLSGGLTVVKVTRVGPTEVALELGGEMQRDQLYTLTILDT